MFVHERVYGSSLGMLVLLLCVGCGQPAEEEPPVILLDDEPMVDMGESVPEVLREVVSRGLYEDMDPSNLIIDPNLSGSGRTDPGFALWDSPFSSTVARVVLSSAPTSQPALRAKGNGSNPVVIEANFPHMRGEAGVATVWLGTEEPSSVEDLSAQIWGWDPEDPIHTQVIDGEPDLSSTVELDGITWTKYTASFAGLHAFGTMRMVYMGSGHVYIQGASVVPSSASATATLEFSPRRRATSEELSATARARVRRLR